MKDYTHYYDIIYTKDKTVFDGYFKIEDYSTLISCYDSKHDAEIAADVIKELCPDVERIIINYNVFEIDTEDEDYYECLTCNIVEDLIKSDTGKWE